jgi:hypothetical protein
LSYFLKKQKKRHIDNGGLGVYCKKKKKNFDSQFVLMALLILENIFVAK